MNDFDFLKQHGFGVVYGAEAVRQKIIDLAIKSHEGKKMTYEQATADLAVTEAGVAEAPVKFHVDADGNLVETEVDVAGYATDTEEVGLVTDEGVVATPADVTIH